MVARTGFTPTEAAGIAERLGIDIVHGSFTLEDFRAGLETELEHGRRDPATDVTGDDALLTGRLALAHLRRLPDYYRRLAIMEAEAEGELAEALDPA